MEPNLPLTREEAPGKIFVSPEDTRGIEITVTLTISPESAREVRRLINGDPTPVVIGMRGADCIKGLQQKTAGPRLTANPE